MIKGFVLGFWLVASGFLTFAQDHIYSQFFNAPVYLNPALNGQFDADLRVNLIYRNQYSAVQGRFNYFTASVDYQIPQFGGGVGLMATRSNEGTAWLVKNNISGVYSYSVGSDDFVLSFGIQAGLTNRSIDFDKLTFADQIDPVTGYNPNRPSGAERPDFNSRFFFDAGAGINLVWKEMMFGGSVQHLNKPDESFTGTRSALPRRFVGHASYRLALSRYSSYNEEGSFIIPSVVYYRQAAAQSISAGFQFKRKSINAGLWYRGQSGAQPDAFVVSLIFDLFINRNSDETLRLGISHDATTSKINYMQTAGSTEGSIGYQTTFPNRNSGFGKFNNARRCYEFY